MYFALIGIDSQYHTLNNMATCFLDATKPLHINGSSNVDQGWRQFTWSKVCGTGGYENVMSWQITSSPSTYKGFHFIVDFSAWRWDGDNIVNSQSWGWQTFYYQNITTSSTWDYKQGTVSWEAGDGVAVYDLYNTGAYSYMRAWGVAGSNIMVGLRVRAYTSEWGRLAINYY